METLMLTDPQQRALEVGLRYYDLWKLLHNGSPPTCCSPRRYSSPSCCWRCACSGGLARGEPARCGRAASPFSWPG